MTTLIIGHAEHRQKPERAQLDAACGDRVDPRTASARTQHCIVAKPTACRITGFPNQRFSLFEMQACSWGFAASQSEAAGEKVAISQIKPHPGAFAPSQLGCAYLRRGDGRPTKD
jgi:hypothetical protein